MRNKEVRVGGRPAGAQEIVKQTGRAGMGAGRQEEGRASGETIGSIRRECAWVQDRPYKLWGGGAGADPFRDLQYPKRSERKVEIGVERDEPGKRGCWGLPRDQSDGGNVHAVIGRVYGRFDAGTNPTPGRHRDLLSGLPYICSQGDTPAGTR